MTPPKISPIIFFDGVCAVCNTTIDFVMSHDSGIFKFASLQGNTATKVLRPDLVQPPYKTIVLMDDTGMYVKSKAITRILSHLDWPWNVLGLLRYFPSELADIFYDFFSSNRYRWFGERESCRIPTKAERERFME